jgi:hypothetical protein
MLLAQKYKNGLWKLIMMVINMNAHETIHIMVSFEDLQKSDLL